MKKTIIAAVLTLAFGTQAHAIVVTDSTNANILAQTLAGSGVAISNAVLSFDTAKPSGTFSGGLAAVGFENLQGPRWNSELPRLSRFRSLHPKTVVSLLQTLGDRHLARGRDVGPAKRQ